MTVAVTYITGPHHPDDWRGEHVATILTHTPDVPPGAQFVTAPNQPLQVASTRYHAGHVVPRHAHPARRRPAFGGQTQEVLVILRGRLLARLWDSGGGYAGEWTLGACDTLVLHGGAHEFQALDDVEFVEVKQGPHDPARDKVTHAACEGAAT